MALRINCSASVFLLPRAPDSKSFDPSKAARLSVKESEGSWRSRCALGFLSVILAVEFANVFVAGEIQALESPPPPELVDSRRVKISRWSDKRKCAPWRANSLEIIVPENLPRPSQRRNWETVTFTDDVENAPAIQGVDKREEKIEI